MAKPADKVFDSRAPDAGNAEVAAANETGADVALERTDFPCSLTQERFWLLDRLDPGNASYNVAVRWRLDGRVSSDVLERAWLKIIERHEILRTVFFEVNGVPMQRIAAKSRFRINEIDLSTLPHDVAQAEGDRIGVIEARAPFDVATGPLLRVTLLRFSPTTSIILVTTHQIVSDGWSIGVMAREMGVIYDALRRDEEIPLEPLPIQYADYTLWQLEWLKARGIEAETQYWSQQLAGVKPFKVIPDRAKPAMASTNGAIVSRVLPRELTDRAQALSAQRGATLFATALATLCATLARFTGETEIVLGTQVSDRDQVELEPMIGQFVNSLILRNHLNGDPSFGALIDGVRDTVAQALEHRHIPIERLLGMVKGERSSANHAPISVNFIFQKTFIKNVAYAEFELTDLPSLPAGAIYDLNFFMVERPDGWRFSCQYNTDQFEGSTAERLLGYFQSMLEGVVSAVDRRLSELPLASPGEARLLLGKLNSTRTLYPRDLTLSKLFEAQAQRAPDAVAVVGRDRQIRYGELAAASNRFAAYLRKRGITPYSRVGVCLEPSVELPICLLGILKAGATYVPLDPAEPPQRRAELVAEAGLTAIIGQHPHTFVVPDTRILLIHIEEALSFAGGDFTSGHIPDADSAACLVFAGGSADAQYLVAMSHRNLANMIYSLAKRPGVTERDVVVARSPLTMERSVFEIFLPLLTGARLVLALDRERDEGRSLLHLLQRSGATLMFAGPQIWSRLLESGWIGYPALKMLCPGLEMPASLSDRLSAIGGELWSLYGHAEASIWSSVQRHVPKQGLLTLGDPIANTEFAVLDSAEHVAVVGAVGELAIAGDGLTDSPRTDVFVTLGGTKWFRTGDKVRLLETGQIEYLGRKDDRFTHAGRVIDPLAVESVLERHPEVARAAVVNHVEKNESLIVAYVVPRAGGHTDDISVWTSQLRQSLQHSLPEYLVPAAILVRDSLPTTATGQTDRRALAMARESSRPGTDPTRPSGEYEERLAAIWKTMLNVDTVDAHANFFELGGHSLLAARMLTVVEREFGRRIKLAAMFLAPTLHEFAKLLSQNDLREFDFRQVVKIQPHGSMRPLIAINNTGIYYGVAKALGPEQPMYSLQLFDPSAKNLDLPQSLEELATRYVELIRRVQPEGPYDLLGWCVAGALAFEIARQLNGAGHEVTRLFLIDSWVPRYFERQSRLRGFIGERTMRLQLLYQDLQRVLSGEKTFAAFVTNRETYKNLARLMRRDQPEEPRVLDVLATPETYDQWLLGYLQELTARYEPKPYPGRVTLLRSRQEPTGLFFDRNAGWAPFAAGGIALSMVDGNHFTMFQERGANQMAQHIAAELETDPSRKSS